jgi:hypothetical protein
MYPIYPLICYMGSVTLVCGMHIVFTLFAALITNASTPSSSSNSPFIRTLKSCILYLILLLSSSLWISRVYSNYDNYHGYLHVWQDISHQLTPRSIESANMPLTLCLGQEWYYFPSHFFLPSTISIGYVEDDFHGLLPAYFETTSSNSERNSTAIDWVAQQKNIRTGTSTLPRHTDFNNRNAEECSRYHPIQQCDLYLHTTSRLIEANKANAFVSGCAGVVDGNETTKQCTSDCVCSVKEKGMKKMEEMMKECKIGQTVILASEKDKPVGTIKPLSFTQVSLIPLLARKVVDYALPKWELAKAYYLPTISPKKVRFKEYILSKVTPTEDEQ